MKGICYRYLINFALSKVYFLSEIKCPIPRVMNGKVEATSDVSFEEKTKLKCDTGFVLNATNLPEKDVTCGSDGQFDDMDLCVSKSIILMQGQSLLLQFVII